MIAVTVTRLCLHVRWMINCWMKNKRVLKCWKKHTAFPYSMEAFTKKKITCLDTHHCLSDSHHTQVRSHLRVFTPEGMHFCRESSVAFCPAINSKVISPQPSWLSSSIWGPWGAFPPALGAQCPQPCTLQTRAWQPCRAALGCAGAFQRASVVSGHSCCCNAQWMSIHGIDKQSQDLTQCSGGLVATSLL